MPASVRVQSSEDRSQRSENREPESVGNELQNIEGKENFVIRNS